MDVAVFSSVYGLSGAYAPFAYYSTTNNVITMNSTQTPVYTTVHMPLPPVGNASLTINMGGGVSITFPAGATLPSAITIQPGYPVGSGANAFVLQFSPDISLNQNQSITVALPVPLNPITEQYLTNATVCWDNGGWNVIYYGKVNNNGTITFTTNHFEHLCSEEVGAALMPTASRPDPSLSGQIAA